VKEAGSPIDFSAVLEMLGGDRDLVHVLLGTFLEELSSDLEASQLALADDDAESLRRLAHRIKGTSASLHALIVSAAARELEQACMEGHPAVIAARLLVMADQAHILMREIREWRSKVVD
jgi:HPt (histidine-containing phosphotransfer) domain-containing protein